MSTRLSVTVTWFPALEIKTGTAYKNRNYHKVLAFFWSMSTVYLYWLTCDLTQKFSCTNCRYSVEMDFIQ